jgi:hypothetical protein
MHHPHRWTAHGHTGTAQVGQWYARTLGAVQDLVVDHGTILAAGRDTSWWSRRRARDRQRQHAGLRMIPAHDHPGR